MFWGVLSMWNVMNAMTGMARQRMMPRRRGNGVGTMTALLIGASVGIAAWEAVRQVQGRNSGSQSNNSSAMEIAQEVMSEIQE
ncbi:hypothetical protein URH17368_1183 [Alicyclobacillus hesperidum URH17-3-68]|nr:hypothetical protein URH17368_1183 [Alicyclobacillus hesperidum URH17-3-68]